MLTPILCFTCGLPIGDRADLFRYLRAKRDREVLNKTGTTPGQAAADLRLQINCSDILDLLGVRSICCRTHLVTAMEFSDHY